MEKPQNKPEVQKSTPDNWSALSVLDPDRWAHSVDKNILTIRYLPYSVALAGAVVLLRSVRLASKFTNASQIPQSFVRKNVQLRGKVIQVNLDATLQVEHLPIVRMPWHGLSSPNSSLNIRLAYISPTIPGLYWMKINLMGRHIKFRLLDRNLDKSQIATVVQTRILNRKVNINQTLVQKGLAVVVDCSGTEKMTKAKSKLFTALKLSEKMAKREGQGMWSDLAQPKWYQLPIELVKGIFSKLRIAMKRQ